MDSLWFTTRSALFQGGDGAWQAVAAYAEPLGRLIARRYAWVKPADREDLVHDLLVEVREKLVAKHDASRGPFRALLQAVVRRRVVDLVRRRSPPPLDDGAAESLAAPPDDELLALDVETSLLEAMAACRDRFTQGPDRDPDVLYALADRVVHGLDGATIAARDGVSVDRVNRLLRRGREALFEALVARELELPRDDGRLELLVDVLREALRRPGETLALVQRIREPALREGMDDLVRRFRAGVAQFAGRLDGSGELQRGLGLILDLS